MAEISWEFGFHPEPLELTNGDITIQPLQNHTTTVAEMENWEDIEKDWVYAPRQPAKDFMTGVVTEKPYSARVFGLPKTHRITHNSADNEDHLTFHLWCLSFFSGLRLTATEAGFLDATPLKAGKLVDFVPMGGSLSKGLEAAEAFWINNRTNIRQTHRLAAAIHALFLAQYPPALQFERFLNLYAALDACYAITAEVRPPSRRIPHAGRAEWLCRTFNMDVPIWADPNNAGGAQVAGIRNDAVHEALFMGEPLGFALHGVGTNQNLPLELQALICRFIVALVAGKTADYVTSSVNSRQIFGLNLM